MSAELKTKKNNKDVDVDKFLASVTDKKRRESAMKVCRMMRDITREPGAMWGSQWYGTEAISCAHPGL